MNVVHFGVDSKAANTHKILTKILKYLCKSQSLSPDPYDLRNKVMMKMSVK